MKVVLHNVMVVYSLVIKYLRFLFVTRDECNFSIYIYQVNSTSLRSATHDEAMQALRQSTGIVRMIILRGEMVNEENKFDTITVDFIKKAGKGLGRKSKSKEKNCLIGIFMFCRI